MPTPLAPDDNLSPVIHTWFWELTPNIQPMERAEVPQSVAMNISRHKTGSI